MIILSDFTGTLVRGTDGFCKTVSGRLPIFESEFKKFFDKMMKPKLNQLFRGRVDEDELWDEAAKDIYICFGDLKIDKPIKASSLKKMFYETIKIPIPGILDIYKRISYYPMHPGKGGRVGKGVPEIAIVSNLIEDMIPLVRQWHPDIFEMAGNEFWSSKTELVLTDPGFFKFLLMGLDGTPDEYLFISRDIEAVGLARKAGIPAIHFKNTRQLEKEMDLMGFMFYPPEEKEGELIRIGFEA